MTIDIDSTMSAFDMPSDEDNERQMKADPNGVAGIGLDFDKAFGGGAGEDEVSDPNQKQTPAQQQEPAAGTVSDPELEKVRNDPEKLARLFQSRLDKAQNQIQAFTQRVEQSEGLQNFFTQLYEDEAVKKAFLHELAPDLVKPINPLTYVQDKLKEEFGDFTPVDGEDKNPATETWLYFKRAEDLLKEGQEKAKTSVPKELKALLTERQVAKQEQALQAQQLQSSLKQEFNWSNDVYDYFSQWVTKLYQEPKHLGKIFNYVMGKGNSKKPAFPNITAVAGSSVQRNAQFADIDKYFG